MPEIDLSILLKLIDNASPEFKRVNAEAIKEVEALKNVSVKASDAINQATESQVKAVEHLRDFNKDAYADMAKSVAAYNVENQKAVFSIEEVTKSLNEFSRVTQTVSRSLNQIGSTLSFTGAGILAPFILAVKDASKSNQQIADSFERISATVRQFNSTVASSLTPTVEKITSAISILNDKFQQLPQGLRDSIIQGTVFGGVMLLISGIVFSMTGRVIGLISNLAKLLSLFIGFAAANLPLVAIIALIAGIVVAMVKWKGVADVVLNTFEILFLHLENGFLAVKIANELFVASALEGVADVLAALASVPGAASEALTNMSNAVRTSASDFKILADRDIHAVKTNLQEMGNILKTGSGDWAASFDDFKLAVTGVITEFDNLIAKPAQFSLVMDEVKNAVNRFLIEAGNVAKKTAAIITGAVDQFSTGWGNAVAAMIVEGKSFADTMKQVFADLVKFIIAEFAKLAAIKLIQFVLGKFFHGGGAVQKASSVQSVPAFHTGGIIRAHDGLAVDEVPIIAQTGEGILSRKGMRALGGNDNLNRLNQGDTLDNSTSSTIYNITINNPVMRERADIHELAALLGNEIERQSRYARS